MKTLYFDIDGTVLLLHEDEVKECLAEGRLEDAIRRTRFEKLVCVGNFAAIAHAVKGVDPTYDGLSILFDLCQGAFADLAWFRSVTTLVKDPERRAEHIDFGADWWYVDDLASKYLLAADKEAVMAQEPRRICTPQPNGDGQDIIDWLLAA